MDTTIMSHEIESFIHDGKSLLKTLLFEQRSAHIIIGKSNLHGNLIFETFTIHELWTTLKITQSLVVVMALSMNRGSQ